MFPISVRFTLFRRQTLAAVNAVRQNGRRFPIGDIIGDNPQVDVTHRKEQSVFSTGELGGITHDIHLLQQIHGVIRLVAQWVQIPTFKGAQILAVVVIITEIPDPVDALCGSIENVTFTQIFAGSEDHQVPVLVTVNHHIRL